MSFDLFPSLPETLSDRLKWMREKNISTRKQDDGSWIAWKGHAEGKKTPFRTGDTEDAALDSLADKLKIKLWNQ